MASADPEFPFGLRRSGSRWSTIHAIGNRDVLATSMVGLVCSVQCPGSIVIKTFDAIRELRDAAIAVAGGFHSPMERECLDFLLRGKQPVIICPAKGLSRPRLPAARREAIDAGRLLLVTPFDESVRRTTKAQAQTRNQFVAALATAVLIPHASPAKSRPPASRSSRSTTRRTNCYSRLGPNRIPCGCLSRRSQSRPGSLNDPEPPGLPRPTAHNECRAAK